MDSLIKGVFPLKGVIQDYAWGGYTYLSELFGIDNTEKNPFAEYWVGVHPRGVARINQGEEWSRLDNYCKLPFLLKILDVNQMLSIQSHPNKTQAEIGFHKENSEGIALDAKHRIFKDDNHKPELMVAMGKFWLLHGFKSEDDIRSTIAKVPEFSGLIDKLSDGVKEFYTYLLQLTDFELVEILSPLKKRLSESAPKDKNSPNYWANLAFEDYGFDKGVFSIYFFNLVHLNDGEAIYQEAGIPHAYLEGKNIEIMANSDNVFRAGLTPKHVDAEVLLAHLDFSPVTPKIITSTAVNQYEKVFRSPAEEFEVSILDIDKEDYSITTHAEECFIVLDGDIQLTSNNKNQKFAKGDCFFSTKDEELKFNSSNVSTIVRASLPKS